MIFQIVKILIPFILIVNIVACSNIFLKKQVSNDNFVEKDMLFVGDSLVSNTNFIKKIKPTCASSTLEITESYKKQCVFYKITFPYEELNDIDSKVIQNFRGINYIIENLDTISNADDFVFKRLIIKKENVITDSIMIYGYENYIEALVQRTYYYYLENNYLWRLKFDIEEEGISIVSWNKYEINEKGKIIGSNS